MELILAMRLWACADEEAVNLGATLRKEKGCRA
jgi:hypothetical protein